MRGLFLFAGDNGRMQVRLLPSKRQFEAEAHEPVLTAGTDKLTIVAPKSGSSMPPTTQNRIRGGRCRRSDGAIRARVSGVGPRLRVNLSLPRKRRTNPDRPQLPRPSPRFRPAPPATAPEIEAPARDWGF